MIEDKRLKLPDYVPVPVEAAKQIAVQFQKQMVVIIATDNVHQQTNFTTYGVSPEEKVEAAVTAEFLSKQMGNVPEANRFSEDFRRDMDAAKYKAALEALERIANILDADNENSHRADDRDARRLRLFPQHGILPGQIGVLLLQLGHGSRLATRHQQ